MVSVKVIKVARDLDQLLKHPPYHPSCWEDLEKHLPKEWQKSHHLIALGHKINLDGKMQLALGLVIENQEDFNEQILFGHAIIVVPKNAIVIDELEVETLEGEHDLFNLVRSYPVYRPRSEKELLNYLPKDWEKTHTLFAIEAVHYNNGITYSVPVKMEDITEIRLLIILDENSFFLVPNVDIPKLMQMIDDDESNPK